MQRGYPCAAQGCESKGPFSFAKENGPFGTPRERLGLAVSSLNILYASGMGIPARGVAAFSIAIRFVSAPTIRCRSADLVGVQPNHRLSPVPTMRRAQQSRISQAVCRQTNVTRASRSKARLQHVTTRRRFMAKPCTPHLIPQAEQLFKLQATNVGGQGAAPLAFSWGSKGAILSRERMAPLSVQRHRRCLSLPRRARETPSPVGQIKKVQLFLKNPLDKWAPRAIMQPTSEELQTYDGEK